MEDTTQQYTKTLFYCSCPYGNKFFHNPVGGRPISPTLSHKGKKVTPPPQKARTQKERDASTFVSIEVEKHYKVAQSDSDGNVNENMTLRVMLTQKKSSSASISSPVVAQEETRETHKIESKIEAEGMEVLHQSPQGPHADNLADIVINRMELP